MWWLGTVREYGLQQHLPVARISPAYLSRGRFFAALVVIGFANGISENVARNVADYGWFHALLGMSGISVIVWGALLAVLFLLEQDRPTPIRRVDVAVAIGVAVAFLLPIPDLSWLALDGLAFLMMLTTTGPGRRAAAILLALTIPMFWARIAMAALGGYILEIDATFVAWIVGTPRQGNLVPFADGSGSLWIAPACSSFANVSLAVLGVVTLLHWSDRNWSTTAILWGAIACLVVIALNTLRIGLIGLYPAEYELLHGAVGSNIASWISTAAILGLGYYGTSRSAPA